MASESSQLAVQLEEKQACTDDSAVPESMFDFTRKIEIKHPTLPESEWTDDMKTEELVAAIYLTLQTGRAQDGESLEDQLDRWIPITQHLVTKTNFQRHILAGFEKDPHTLTRKKVIDVFRAILLYDQNMAGFFNASVETSAYGMVCQFGLFEILVYLNTLSEFDVPECMRETFVPFSKVHNEKYKVQAMYAPVNEKRLFSAYHVMVEPLVICSDVVDFPKLGAPLDPKHNTNLIRTFHFLTENAVPLRVLDANQETLLHWLAKPSHDDQLRKVYLAALEKNCAYTMADANIPNVEGKTALWIAVVDGNSEEVVRRLVRMNASIYMQVDGQSLTMAVYEATLDKNGKPGIGARYNVAEQETTALQIDAQSKSVTNYKSEQVEKSMILYLSKQFEIAEELNPVNANGAGHISNACLPDDRKVMVSTKGVAYSMKYMDENAAMAIVPDCLSVVQSGSVVAFRATLMPTMINVNRFPVQWAVTTFPNARNSMSNHPVIAGIGVHTFLINVMDYLAFMGVLNTHLNEIRLNMMRDVSRGKQALVPQIDDEIKPPSEINYLSPGARVAAQAFGHERLFFQLEALRAQGKDQSKIIHSHLNSTHFVRHVSHDLTPRWIAIPRLSLLNLNLLMSQFTDNKSDMPPQQRDANRFSASIPGVSLDVTYVRIDAYERNVLTYNRDLQAYMKLHEECAPEPAVPQSSSESASEPAKLPSSTSSNN